MAAPIVAEIPNVMVPLTFLIGFNLAGVVASIMLRTKKTSADDHKDDPVKEKLVHTPAPGDQELMKM